MAGTKLAAARQTPTTSFSYISLPFLPLSSISNILTETPATVRFVLCHHSPIIVCHISVHLPYLSLRLVHLHHASRYDSPPRRRRQSSRIQYSARPCNSFHLNFNAKLTIYQPAFLRASHSPWNWIPQRLLVKLRGLVLAYLTGSGCMSLYYKLTEFTDHPKLYLLFHFGSLSFLITLIYHLITFVCRRKPSSGPLLTQWPSRGHLHICTTRPLKASRALSSPRLSAACLYLPTWGVSENNSTLPCFTRRRLALPL